MLGVGPVPSHGVWIKGRPAGSLVPEVRPASRYATFIRGLLDNNVVASAVVAHLRHPGRT